MVPPATGHSPAAGDRQRTGQATQSSAAWVPQEPFVLREGLGRLYVHQSGNQGESPKFRTERQRTERSVVAGQAARASEGRRGAPLAARDASRATSRSTQRKTAERSEAAGYSAPARHMMTHRLRCLIKGRPRAPFRLWSPSQPSAWEQP